MTTTKKPAKKPAAKGGAKPNPSKPKEVASARDLTYWQNSMPKGTVLYHALKKRTPSTRHVVVIYPEQASAGLRIATVTPGIWKALGKWDEKSQSAKFTGTGYSVMTEARRQLGALIWGDVNAFEQDSTSIT